MESLFAAALFFIPPILTLWLIFSRREGLAPADALVSSGLKQAEPTHPPEPQSDDNRFWTLFANAFRLRCPVCKKGKIFPGWFKVEDRCPHCGIELARESGYYIGSIYFNYGLTGAIEVAAYVGLRFGLGMPDRFLLVPLAAFAVLFPLYFFRYARSSWLVFDQYFHPRVPPGDSEPPGERLSS